MSRSIFAKTIVVVFFSLGLLLTVGVAEVQHTPFTTDKSPDFQPLGVTGHERCFVKEIAKGVTVGIMYGSGEMEGKVTVMELVLSPEAYKAYPKKLEDFEEHKELGGIYVKHFYAHDVKPEMHREHKH